MSVTAVGPLLSIDGPLPVAPDYNIFSVAEPLSGRWLAGINMWPYPPDVAAGIDPCLEGTFREKDEGEGYASPSFHAFTGYLPVVCSTITVDLGAVRDRAERAMDATDHVVAEQQLVSGTYVGNPYLAQTTNILGGGAVSPRVAIALLEQEIGEETGRKGVIHLDPATASFAATDGAFVLDGKMLKTHLGTPVIVGTGYIGAHPDTTSAPSAGTSYAWASGPVVAGRDEMSLSDDLSDYLDWAQNEYVYRAERNIVVAWDTQLSAAVLVDWTP